MIKLTNRPLLTTEAGLQEWAALLERAASWDGEQKAFLDYDAGPSYSVTGAGVGVLDITGPLMHSASPIMKFFGVSTYSDLSAAFGEMLADETVKHIALNINSPGGSVNGCFDFADEVFSARGVKPVTAVVNEHAYSAAFAIASAADSIALTRTAGVGSVGVITQHVDYTKAAEQEGVKVTAIYAGKHKNDFSQYQELTDEARASIQADIDRTYDLFVSTVARNRGISEDAVRKTEAGLFYGEQALQTGFADTLASTKETIAEITASVAKQSDNRRHYSPIARRAAAIKLRART